MTYQTEVAADVPLQYYRFENSAALGTMDPSATGTVVPTIGAGVTSAPSGIQGGLGADFSGASGGYMSWNYGTGNYIFRPTNAWTYEAWVKLDANKTAAQTLLVRSGAGGLVNISIAASNASGSLTPNAVYLQTQDSGGTNVYTTGAAAVIDDTDWHHVVATSTGTTLTLYVDNVSIGTQTARAINTSSFTTAYVGAASTGGASALDGKIDELAFYSAALSSTRIAAHYNAGYVAAQTSVTAQSPAIVINASAPAPVVTAVDSTVPVTTTYNADYDADQYGNNDQTSTSLIMQGGIDSAAYIHFPSVTFTNPNHVIQSAILRVTEGFSNPSAATISVRRLTAAFTEGTGSMATVASVDHGISFNIPQAGSGATGRPYTVDITPIVQAWKDGAAQHGIALVATYSSAVNSTENATVAYRPTLAVTMGPVPVVPVTVSVPAITATLTAPNAVSRAGQKTVVTGAGSGSVTMPAPVISTVKTVKVQPTAITFTQLFAGGISRNPDQFIHADAMVLSLTSPDVSGRGGSNHLVPIDDVIEINLEMSDSNFSNRLDKRNFVNGAMSLSARMVGIYTESGDRYKTYLPGTLTSLARWFPLDEISGTTANDEAYSIVLDSDGDEVAVGKNDALYVGGPEFNVQGPQLRPAVRFDGVDDYLSTGQVAPVGASLNLEFSIKTTQQNGTFLTGTGSSREYIRLIDGELVFENRSGLRNHINKYIADGEWHHVVIVLEHYLENMTNQRTFAVVDGNLEFTRYLMDIDEDRLMPTAVMAQVIGSTASDHLAGELADFIIRAGSPLTVSQAQKLYYEWSEATLVSPEPITINLSVGQPKVIGSVKKMLVLYGAGHSPDPANFTYYSIFAAYGLSIQEYYNKTGNREFPIHKDKGSLFRSPNQETPRPFMMHGHLVYAAGIAGGTYRSAPGVIKPESLDINNPAGYFIDDKTGEARFLNLQDDLVGGPEEYDVITVMNYPPERSNIPVTYEGIVPTRFGEPIDIEYPMVSNPLSGIGAPSNYPYERDRFRDSLLEAAYDGANLWIPEAHAAAHLGLITGYDKHYTYGQWNTNLDDPGSPHVTYNLRAAELDEAHGVANPIEGGLEGLGRNYDYRGYYQANAHRLVVATEPGLTDIPSWEYGERIDRDMYDWLKPHAKITAYEAKYYDHFSVGDRVAMNMSYGQTTYYNNTGLGVPRIYIMSARPEGIVGKIITKEVDYYYTWNTTAPVTNPWRNNAYTIAAERGSVVRGRAIGGRIFMEFMDARSLEGSIAVDRKQFYEKWLAGGNAAVQNVWAYDERRYREVVVLITRTRLAKRGEDFTEVNDETYYSDFENSDLMGVPYVSMTARGLNWLGEAEELPLGDAKVYAPAMTMNVTAPSVKSTQGRNIVNAITGTMTLTADFIEPASVDNPDYSTRALPMVLSVEMRGAGKAIKVVGAIELSLTATSNTTGRGDGERIYVYINAENSATLYIKED